MSEINNSDTPNTFDAQPSEQTQFDQDGITESTALEMWEAAQDLRVAQEGWLERRGELEDISRITMTRREFDLLRDLGLGGGSMTSFLIDKTKNAYNIPPDAQYVWMDIVPDDANLPHIPKLVGLSEGDFGTVVDEERFEEYGIEPASIPRITMEAREFALFGVVGFDDSHTAPLVEYARDICGIPQDDQFAPQYALIDIESDDPNLPNKPLLVVVNEEDFGTVIDREVIDRDNEYLNLDSDPDSPSTPEDAHVTVDITEALNASVQDIRMVAGAIMRGKTINPLEGTIDPDTDEVRDVGIRAGGLMTNQKDAYFWTVSPLTRSMELTVANPRSYNSICVVHGQKQEAPNGKAGMARMINPEEMLKIEGENLRQLQEVYKNLYHQPNFALTEQQRRERDEIFNDYFAQQITLEAKKNKDAKQAQADYESRRQQPQLRAREIPR